MRSVFFFFKSVSLYADFINAIFTLIVQNQEPLAQARLVQMLLQHLWLECLDFPSPCPHHGCPCLLLHPSVSMNQLQCKHLFTKTYQAGFILKA